MPEAIKQLDPLINKADFIKNNANFGTVQSVNGRDIYTSGANSTTPGEQIDLGITEPASTNPLFNVNSTTNVSSNSDSVRNAENQVITNSQNLLNDINNVDLNTTIQDIKNQIGYRAPTGSLTDAEQQQINQAGIEAAAQYDDLIATAEQAKTEGLPKALIAAGERGGFMSTQFSGAAALTPTQGGTFIGAGGELENIKSAYDRNIDSLKSAQQRAISVAKAAAEKAIRTGIADDNRAAAELFQMAQDANTKALNLIKAKQDIISSYERDQEARIEFGQEQEDRQIESLLGTIQPQLTGDPTQDQAIIEKVAREQGVDANRLTTVLNDYVSQKQDDALKTVASKIDIANQIPEGEIYVDEASGVRILGTKPGETMDIVQTIGNNEYQVRYDLSDPANPKKLFAIDLGPRWKTTGGGGSSVGSSTYTTIDDAIVMTANYLDGLKNKEGLFNDITYESSIRALQSEYAIPEEQYDKLKSIINNQMAALRGESIYEVPRGGEQNQQNNSDFLSFLPKSQPQPTPSKPKTVKENIADVQKGVDIAKSKFATTFESGGLLGKYIK